MNMLIKWTLLFAILMMVINKSPAWNIGSKGRVAGPMIHSTYFLTPNNAQFKVQGRIFVGYLTNGVCNFATSYNVGSDNIKTGDVVDIDAFALKSVVGGGYSCMTVFYTYQQTAMETIELFYDGVNYTRSIPEISQIQIL